MPDLLESVKPYNEIGSIIIGALSFVIGFSISYSLLAFTGNSDLENIIISSVCAVIITFIPLFALAKSYRKFRQYIYYKAEFSDSYTRVITDELELPTSKIANFQHFFKSNVFKKFPNKAYLVYDPKNNQAVLVISRFNPNSRFFFHGLYHSGAKQLIRGRQGKDLPEPIY